MIPRFSNPHSLPQFFKTVPRSELYHDDNQGASFTHNEVAIAELDQLLAQSIGVIQYEPKNTNCQCASPQKSEKRRRSECDIQEQNIEEEPEQPPLFRLVSSVVPPLPISLLSPPPPPSITRDPEPEDSELQATVRRKRAQAASVDVEVILRHSKIIESSASSSTSAQTKTINLRAKLGYSSPPIMIVRTVQTPRKTRPPVDSSMLARFPYNLDVSALSIEPVKSRIMDCPTIDAESTYVNSSTAHRRSRRRRKISSQDKKRPVPQFWRPSPSLAGKCRGYAYGYPSYLDSATGSTRVKYSRDRMKKGVHVDN